MESGKRGEIRGITGFQNTVMGAVNERSNINVTDSQINTEQINARNISIIETKKRRTDNGLDINNCLGQHKDIIMESEGEILSEINEETTDNSSMPKNVFGASTHGSARLPL